MISSLRSVALGVLLTSCGQGSNSSAPNPVTPIEDLCRCDGFELHLAVVRIETTPVPHSDNYMGSGESFEMTVLQSLAATNPRQYSGQVVPIGTRVRVRRYLRNIDGTPFYSYVPGTPPPVSITQGMQIIVSYRLATGIDDNLYLGGPLPVDPASNTLSARWMQFPVGTPASQILNPIEWNNPMRGCGPDCRPNLGPPSSDAAVFDVLSNG